MTAVTHNRFLVPAWTVSLALHGVGVTLAMLFAAQVRPVFQEEPFKWDVALVETAKTDSPTEAPAQAAADPIPPVVRPMQAQVRPTPSRVEPPPDTVMHRVARQQTMQMMHPETQPPKPIEQRQDPPPPLKTEPLTPPVPPAPEKTIEPVEQQVAELSKTRPEPMVPTKEPEPVQSSEPVIAEHKPVAPPPSEAVEPRPVEAPAPSAPSLASSPRAEPSPAAPSPAAPAHEAPMQTAKASPGPVASEAPVLPSSTASRSDVKADHRWLAESLGRRLAELKRYPNEARVSRLQGKVILKAVIRSDGHLADVSVHKSSGHSILDEAAMEAVRSACPLHMQHDIGRPIIVVQVPIVYSLNN